MVPGLLPDQQEGQDLEGQAGEDLGEDGEEQRGGDEPGGGALGHQLPPGRVQTHWGGEGGGEGGGPTVISLVQPFKSKLKIKKLSCGASYPSYL